MFRNETRSKGASIRDWGSSTSLAEPQNRFVGSFSPECDEIFRNVALWPLFCHQSRPNGTNWRYFCILKYLLGVEFSYYSCWALLTSTIIKTTSISTLYFYYLCLRWVQFSWRVNSNDITTLYFFGKRKDSLIHFISLISSKFDDTGNEHYICTWFTMREAGRLPTPFEISAK